MSNKFHPGNLNQGLHMGMMNQWAAASTEELLNGLRGLAMFGDQNMNTQMILGETWRRGNESFDKSIAPSADVHGESWLHLSFISDGLLIHVFVDDNENVNKLRLVSETTLDIMKLPGELNNLGKIFRAVFCLPTGQRVREIRDINYAQILAWQTDRKASGRQDKYAYPVAIVPATVSSILQQKGGSLSLLEYIMNAVNQQYPIKDPIAYRAKLIDFLTGSKVVEEFQETALVRSEAYLKKHPEQDGKKIDDILVHIEIWDESVKNRVVLKWITEDGDLEQPVKPKNQAQPSWGSEPGASWG